MISGIKNFIGATTIAVSTFVGAPAVSNAQSRLNIDNKEFVIPASGSKDSLVLANAPSCDVFVKGKKEQALFVVDTETNCLYHYDDNGKAMTVYSIATGKKSTPTDKGLRRITHVEVFPYKNAPARTKRRKTPSIYGPRIIFFEGVDSITGKKFPVDEFLHGSNDPNCYGKYVSKGCMRMKNDVIREMAKIAKRGLYVLIK